MQALYISKNYLTTLDGIRQLQGLKKLSAADNCLADFASLDGLQVHAQTLVAANFEGNPVAMLPNYRAQVRRCWPLALLRLSLSKDRTRARADLAPKTLDCPDAPLCTPLLPSSAGAQLPIYPVPRHTSCTGHQALPESQWKVSGMHTVLHRCCSACPSCRAWTAET